MNWWVLYRGKVTLRPLFTNRHYRDHVANAGQGREAFFVDNNEDVRVIYDEEEQVFHLEGERLERFREQLDARPDIARHCR